MKRLNFALISDVLFFTVCAFIITFTAIRFYFKNAVTALVLASLAALACGVIAFMILYSKRKKRLILSANESEKKSLSLHLSVCSRTEILKLFKDAIEGAYIGGNGLEDEENQYFFHFKLSPVSPDEIAEIIKFKTEKCKQIFCCEVAPYALSLAQDFSIKVLTIAEIYGLLKERKLLPEKYALGNVKKPNAFSRIRHRFNRRLCPSLFFCGLSLLFFSFFTYFPVYYVVFGGILTALAAVCVLIEPT